MQINSFSTQILIRSQDRGQQGTCSVRVIKNCYGSKHIQQVFIFMETVQKWSVNVLC